MKYQVYERHPEINYAIVKLEDATYQPYVATFMLDEENECWAQGHYFCKYSEAREYIREVYRRKYENVRRLEPEYSAIDYSDDGNEILIQNNLTGERGWFEYELNLNIDIPDEVCCRVKMNGKWYYFG